jgi:hypothetical protein
MPTILRIRGFRIGFYQADIQEPPHVHVRRQSGDAKFWLDPIVLADARGFADHELRDILRILESNQEKLLAEWRAEEAKHGDGSGDHSGK